MESVQSEADSITLSGLRVQAHHGVFEQERRDGQEFVIDLTVWLDTRTAASCDELAATVHYGALAVDVADAVRRDPVDLIETLAQRIADVALERPAAARVRVTVHKPEAPIPERFDDVSITITRSRP